MTIRPLLSPPSPRLSAVVTVGSRSLDPPPQDHAQTAPCPLCGRPEWADDVETSCMPLCVDPARGDARAQ